jgi:hypothetical protein
LKEDDDDDNDDDDDDDYYDYDYDYDYDDNLSLWNEFKVNNTLDIEETDEDRGDVGCFRCKVRLLLLGS